MGKAHRSILDDGKEIFANQLFEKLPTTTSLKTFFELNAHLLSEVLSIKINPQAIPKKGQGVIPSVYYNIETEQTRTLFSYPPHHGRDPTFWQYHKQSGLEKGYSPYSANGYNFFVQMLSAYYMQQHLNDDQGKIEFPKVDFSSVNIKEWMDYESEQDSSIKDQILDVFAFGDVPYFFNRRETHFKSDENGNYRIILPTINEEERTGFGIQGGKTVFRFPGDYKTQGISEIVLENNLLPLYIQTFIDIHSATSQGGAEIKKLFEVTKYLLEKKCFGKSFNPYSARKQTPLTEE